MLSLIDMIMAAILFAVLYTNIFHLLLWLEQREKLKERGKAKAFPMVSVIVPAYNEAKNIKRCLKSILKQNYPKEKLEVIVVDDGSEDKTYEIAKGFQKHGVKVFRKRHEGKARALNFGLKKARGELVAVVDADSILDRDAIRKCISYFDSKEVAAVTSHILPRGNSLLEKLQRLEFMVISVARKLQEAFNLIYATPGPLSVYRKDVLLKLGGFDERNLTEDVEICWRIIRAGYRVRMAYDARVTTKYPKGLKSWLRQRARWNIGGMQTLRKHFSAIFDEKTTPIKTWQIPLFLVGFASTLAGLCLFTYLWANFLIKNALYLIESLALGGNPLKLAKLWLNIDIFTILGAIVFVTTLYSVLQALKLYDESFSKPELLIFLFIYVMLFPLALGYAVLKVLLQRKGWLTK